MASTTKRTRRWRERNPDRAAGKNRRDALNWRRRHPDEAREKARRFRESHSDRHIRRAYGLTREAYDALAAAQGGVCGACGRPETATRAGVLLKLSVDHVHGTGRVRGLLCSRCNRGIGNFDDDPERLVAAANYLRSHEVPV